MILFVDYNSGILFIPIPTVVEPPVIIEPSTGLLINAGEVVDIAFFGDYSTALISDGIIQTAQNKYIKNVLGRELYNSLVASRNEYHELLELVRDTLAWWVKYLLSYSTVSDTGIKHIDTKNTTVSNRKIELSANILVVCDNKTKQITRYLNNSDFSNYKRSKNVDDKISFAGGIITRN